MKNKQFLVFKSINIKTLLSYKIFIVNLFNKLNIKPKIFFLPVKEKKITLIKSPHVKKKNKESFKISFYKLIFIFTNNSFKIENWIYYLFQNKPKSVLAAYKL
jgi:ribosomal protein S10